MRLPLRRSLALAVTTCALAPAAAAAQAPGPCDGWTMRTVASGLGGRVENLEMDGRGGMFVGQSDGDTVSRISPQGKTEVLASGVESPGGIRVRWPYLYVNTDNSLQAATTNSTAGTIERIDLRDGKRTTWTRGLTAPNGLVLLSGGDALVSRALGSGTGITRIDAAAPDRPQFNWARVDGANGLTVDAAGRWLYTPLTFTPESRILRIDLTDPSRVEEVMRFAGPAPKGVDDLAIDRAGILYLAANGSGEVLRLDPATKEVCALASGIRQPSSVRVGCGPGWPSDRLYVSAFDGTLREIKPPEGRPGAAGSTSCADPATGPGAGAAPDRAGSARCTSRRAFRVRVRRGRPGDRVVSARVTLDGRRLRVRRRGGRLTARVDLRGRARGRAVVRIVARTRSGRRIVERRRYRTCVPRS